MATQRPSSLGGTGVKSRPIQILLVLCWAGTILGLLAIPLSHSAGEHWEYFAIYGQVPVVIDGDIEFGFLAAERPYARVEGWLVHGPYPYYKHWAKPPAEIAEFGTIWQGAGLSESRGLLIPPWGWRVAPVYPYAPGDLDTPGEDPNRAIPYVMYQVPLIYMVALFAAWPVSRWVRQAHQHWTRKPGTCRNCGYDLRATPQRCPECGLKQE